MKMYSSTRGGLAATVRPFLALTLFFTLGAMAFGLDVQRVAGLKARGGVGKIDIDQGRDGKDFKDIASDMAHAPEGTLQFWTWLQGNADALKALKQPGILPLSHEVLTPGVMHDRVIDVKNVGEEKRRRPEWRRSYLDLLTNEFNKNGAFITSGLSQCDLPSHTQRYTIRFRTSDGKVLGDADGNPIVLSVTAQR